MMNKTPAQADPFVDTKADPRPYQNRIVNKAIQKLHRSQMKRERRRKRTARSVLVQSPTGSGKTVIGLEIARQLQQCYGYSVGWVAMRRNLLTQVSEMNHELGFNVDLEPISMFEKDPPKVDLLVIDECHHDATQSMSNLHAMIQSKKVLGLTATSFRTDGRHLCFDSVIRDVGIQQLIQDGYLSRYRHYTIPKYTPVSVARLIANEPDRWGRSLVFFHKREQCDECQQILASHGIAADVVTATTDRERQIADFTNGRIDVLISMYVLTEGFDFPGLQTVFCRPSGKLCTIQMAGRVFRKHPDISHKQIVQSTDTRHPFLKTALPDEQYILTDGEWRSLTLNPHIVAISDRALQMIAHTETSLPSLLKSRSKKKRGRTVDPDFPTYLEEP